MERKRSTQEVGWGAGGENRGNVRGHDRVSWGEGDREEKAALVLNM